MNKEMMQAMALEGGGDQAYQDSPEAPIQVPNQSGQMVEADPESLAAEGMAFATRDMVKNGPVMASHSMSSLERGLDENKLTKGQLREQVMNEDQGYPSNLDEANKVKALDQKIAGVDAKLDAIIAAISPPRLGANPTSAAKNAAQSSLVSPPVNGPTGGNQVSPAAVQIPTPEASVTVPPPNHPSIASSGLKEPENKQPLLRQVTLNNGKIVSVPQTSRRSMSLGSATETPPPLNQFLVEEARRAEELDLSDPKWDDNPSDWDEPLAVVPDPEPEPKKSVDAQRLVKLQQLVQDVNGFMQASDTHRFWRRHIGQKIHRNVGYNGWPKKLQVEFDERFKNFLQDPQFVTSVCRKVMSMEMGHGLGAKQVASLLVATAGFIAFGLCGLDG
jgi:hypothetical protein